MAGYWHSCQRHVLAMHADCQHYQDFRLLNPAAASRLTTLGSSCQPHRSQPSSAFSSAAAALADDAAAATLGLIGEMVEGAATAVLFLASSYCCKAKDLHESGQV